MSGENPNTAHKPHTNCQHNGRGVIICAFSTTTGPVLRVRSSSVYQIILVLNTRPSVQKLKPLGHAANLQQNA